MNDIMYRSEDSYGSGVRDVLDIMTFEIYELKNPFSFENLLISKWEFFLILTKMFCH